MNNLDKAVALLKKKMAHQEQAEHDSADFFTEFLVQVSEKFDVEPQEVHDLYDREGA